MAKQHFTKNDAPRRAKAPFSLEGKKHIMGAYFNMAQSNFTRTILEIFNKAGLVETGRRVDALKLIDKYSNTDIIRRSELKVRLQKLLFHHFPVLGPIMADKVQYRNDKTKKSEVVETEEILKGISLRDCLEIIGKMGSCLNDCRNYYTHFEPYNDEKEIERQMRLQKAMANCLNKAFTASRRIDKERELLTTVELEFLTGIDHYKKEKEKDENGNLVYEYNKKLRRNVPVIVFKEREDYYFRISGKRNNYDALSDFGVLYFCILFLSKNYAKRLIEETGLLKEGNSPFKDEENDIVREMLSIYRMRTSRGKRLNSNDTQTALAMDMLNELRKCPMPLYEVLSKEGKEFFWDDVDGDGNLPEKVKRLRSTDRFPYLVLKYFDAKEVLPSIRFQIQLGKFRFKFYEKNGVDGNTRMRTLQKEINGFGRLQEIEEQRKVQWADMMQQSELMDVLLEDGETVLQLQQYTEDSADTKPYITDNKASYNIFNNRVGLYWNSEESHILRNGIYIPELDTQNGKANVNQPAPKATLSIYDLPAMAFYQYLYDKNGCKEDKGYPSVEEVIKDWHKRLSSFFKDIKEGKVEKQESETAFKSLLKEQYGLNISDIPDKLAEFFSGDYSNKKKKPASKLFNSASLTILREREARTRRKLEKFKKDLKAISSKDNNYAKKGFSEIRYNNLASYIAKSLLEWQPAANDGSNKLTGQNYNVLVAFLATYYNGKSISELTNILVKSRLIRSQYNHPFIQEVLNMGPKNLEDLYKRYLEKELDYINKCLQGRIDIKSIPFLHANRLKWQQNKDPRYYQQLAGRYLEIEEGKDATIILPDGLFTPYVLKVLKEKYAIKNQALQELLANDELNNNSSYLISRFFGTVRGDNGQPFYRTNEHFMRTYDIFNILDNKKKGNPLLPQYLTTDRINERMTERVGEERKILKDIDNRVNGMTDRDRGNFKTLDEAKDAMKNRLKRAIRDCKNNERAIRRYKNQDMVLFLLAQTLLQEIIPDKEIVNDRNFMLKKVCESGFLSQAVRMEKTLEVDMNGEKKEVKIVHENMSLKNYGEFYRLVNDERLLSLLQQLGDCGEVDYSSLNAEFAIYDQERSSVFQAIQNIEKYIIENHPELQSPDNEHFCKEGTTIPKRNNFNSLLQLLDNSEKCELTEDDKKLIVSIRNAFSHNSYRVDMASVGTGRIELPKVADLLLKIIEGYRNRIIE